MAGLSQDSGFSDSGESNCGQSLPPNPGSSSSTISSGINNSAGIAVGRNATTTTTTPMSLSGPTSLGSAFRRKASRVFYASEEKLDEQDWPRPGANVWYSSTCSRVEFNEARLCSTADAVRHPPVVRFGKTKSVPSLEDSSTSGTSSSGPSSQFTLSNIRRTLFGSKSSHDLNNTGSPKPATLPSSCKTASPVQKGILKKQQRDDNFRRSSPSTCRSPASFTC
ncbi:unnamed protein product [Notodromas monacha]|uniref:Uncharacterized protein n=1 Tax=Notodromas monacha TaxID=399045 RepID=A0A7R9BKM9_9CRUS|nr:unnamed protein product [Notodromas monacha]CAG0917230.1 unnamed protein product [Notodromas monacha]